MKSLIRLCLMAVCGPLLSAATFTVTTTANSGPGSLRQAITDANASVGVLDTIAFTLPGVGVQTIGAVNLPPITDPVILDGTTQPGYAGTPLLFLDGAKARAASSGGLMITAGNSVVRGLAIGNVGRCCDPGQGPGLLLQGGGSNRVEACFIGTDATGLLNKLNRFGGVIISNSVANVIGGSDPAQRNIISGNSLAGVVILGVSASNNVVSGNLIGLGADGATVLGNSEGILIQDGATANRIGGSQAAARNVIVNYDSNLHLQRGAAGNTIQGNLIGLRADGTAPTLAGLNRYGVNIKDSPGNHVGGLAVGAGNVISGNDTDVVITGAAASGNVVQGNLIGTDPTGGVQVRVPTSTGILVIEADGVVIGGASPGAGNLISGHGNDGIFLLDVSDSVVQGNLIGTDRTGRIAFGNGHTNGVGGGGSGVTLSSLKKSTANNLIGGADAAARNVISGNLWAGLVVNGNLTVSNVVQGNFIGTDVTGTNALGNLNDGLQVYGAVHTLIGGTQAGAGNVISANGGNGIFLAGYFGIGASNTVILGNRIGLGAGGSSPGAASSAVTSRRGQAVPSGMGDPPIARILLYNLIAAILNYYADLTVIGMDEASTDNKFAGGGRQAAIQNRTPSTLELVRGTFTTPKMGIPFATDASGPVPMLASAVTDAGGFVHVMGSVNAPPGAKILVNLYGQSADADWTFPGGTVHGIVPMGGTFDFSQDFPNPPAFPGGSRQVVATATILYQTYNFSSPIPVTPAGGATVFQFSSPVYSVSEGTTAVIPVRRTGSDSMVHSVSYSIFSPTPPVPGGATADVDFIPKTATLTFASGEMEKTVNLPTIANQRFDGTRFAALKLFQPTGGAVLGEYSQGIVVINDNDKTPRAPTALSATSTSSQGVGFDWEGGGFLQIAPALGSQLFITVAGAVSPHTLSSAEVAKGAQQLARVVSDAPRGNLSGTLKQPSGKAVNYIITQVGDRGPVGVTDERGGYRFNNVPAGHSRLHMYLLGEVLGIDFGALNLLAALSVDVDVAPGSSSVVDLKVDLDGEGAKPPCGCTPWCAIAGGTVNGVQQVVVSGGKNGKCGETAQVTITAPGGSAFPLRGHENYSPAEDGVWTVTSTVCGVTKTCTITLP